MANAMHQDTTAKAYFQLDYTLGGTAQGGIVLNAQCADLKRRNVVLAGSTENKLYMPAYLRLTYKGRRYKVTGYVSADWIHPEDHPECDYRFYANCEGKNAVLVFMTGVADVERCECGRFAARDTGYCLSSDCQSIRMDRQARLRNRLQSIERDASFRASFESAVRGAGGAQ